eukprot:g1006.t1
MGNINPKANIYDDLEFSKKSAELLSAEASLSEMMKRESLKSRSRHVRKRRSSSPFKGIFQNLASSQKSKDERQNASNRKSETEEFKNLTSLDIKDSLMKVHVGVLLEWSDFGAVNKKGNSFTVPRCELWKPCLEIANGVSNTKHYAHYLGLAHRRGQPIVNEFFEFNPTLRVSLDLREFPFDQQYPVIKFTSGRHDTKRLKFHYPIAPEISWEDCHNLEYEVLGISMKSTTMYYPLLERCDGFDGQYPIVEVHLHLKRRPAFYLKRIVLMSLIITFLECLSFFVDPTDFSGRFAITGTLILTATSFSTMQNNALPRLPYLTRLDKLLNCHFILLFASACENLFITELLNAYHADKKLTRSVDMFFLSIYIGLVLSSFLWFLRPLLNDKIRHFEVKYGFKIHLIVAVLSFVSATAVATGLGPLSDDIWDKIIMKKKMMTSID